ncbi:hypothetical protein CABS03_04689 [Colletotrichum abscissum]
MGYSLHFLLPLSISLFFSLCLGFSRPFCPSFFFFFFFCPPPPSDSQSLGLSTPPSALLPSASFIILSIRTSLCLFLNYISHHALIADPSSCHIHSL